jgi:voltage-gated potassium channel
VGKTLAELSLRGRYDLLPLAIRKPNGGMKFNPRDETIVASGDALVVMGEVANAWKAREAAGEKSPHRAT